MQAIEKTMITIDTTVKATVEKVWEYWTKPEHIMQWNNASDDWHTPFAENDLKEGGKFLYRMAAKDNSFGFDFYGVYTRIKQNELIEYTLADGRTVTIHFSSFGPETRVVEMFEAESENSVEMQKGGWQAILNNFKRLTEKN